jgi:hypothetical protein
MTAALVLPGSIHRNSHLLYLYRGFELVRSGLAAAKCKECRALGVSIVGAE